VRRICAATRPVCRNARTGNDLPRPSRMARATKNSISGGSLGSEERRGLALALRNLVDEALAQARQGSTTSPPPGLQPVASRLVVEVRAGFGVQTIYPTICNAQSRLDVRLAPWLLMAHDLIGEDTLSLTRVFVAHAWRLPTRRDGSPARPPGPRIHFVGPWADHRDEPQRNGARGGGSLWHSRGRISPTDRVKCIGGVALLARHSPTCLTSAFCQRSGPRTRRC
jgi:hypothetical protein